MKSFTQKYRDACTTHDVETVKNLLFAHEDIDVNFLGSSGQTTVWKAAHTNSIKLVKWIIALRGKDLDITLTADCPCTPSLTTPLELARKFGQDSFVKLLVDFETDKEKTIRDLRIELGLRPIDVAALFSVVIFHSDGLLQLKKRLKKTRPVVRFFKITSRLPIELQMIICNMALGSSKEFVKTKDSEPAFKKLASCYLLS